MRKLSSLLGNEQRLDGGAMFGNAPRALWTRWAEPDEQNRIRLACRCLLVEEENRKILFEAGIGAFFSPELRQRYGVMHPEHRLLQSLAARGLTAEDIDVVMLSHLHFDHAGGLLCAWRSGETPSLAFPRARFLVGRVAWERAIQPHLRDRASFVPALNELLRDSGRLEWIDAGPCEALGDGFRLIASDGHTPGMLLTEIAMPRGPIVFAADLVPGRSWLHLPITMGYDRFPERLIEEKQALLEDLRARGGRLFYTHDPDIALSAIERDEKRRYRSVAEEASLDGLTE